MCALQQCHTTPQPIAPRYFSVISRQRPCVIRCVCVASHVSRSTPVRENRKRDDRAGQPDGRQVRRTSLKSRVDAAGRGPRSSCNGRSQLRCQAAARELPIVMLTTGPCKGSWIWT